MGNDPMFTARDRGFELKFVTKMRNQILNLHRYKVNSTVQIKGYNKTKECNLCLPSVSTKFDFWCTFLKTFFQPSEISWDRPRSTLRTRTMFRPPCRDGPSKTCLPTCQLKRSQRCPVRLLPQTTKRRTV